MSMIHMAVTTHTTCIIITIAMTAMVAGPGVLPKCMTPISMILIQMNKMA